MTSVPGLNISRPCRDLLGNSSVGSSSSSTSTRERSVKEGASSCNLILLLLPLLITADKCNKDDKRALLSIKSAFNSAYHFASWTSTSACCDWYDIECDSGIPGNSAGSRVTGLFFITNSNVTGPIPPVVSDLLFLTSLSFHKLPNLVDNIPSSITRLTRLFVLLLTWNSLSGPIPSFLSQTPSLIIIDLSFNLFSGSIPPQLVNLPSLLDLDYSRNRLTGAIPSEFGNFPKSSPPDLVYSHNKLFGNLPVSLGLPEWGKIDLSRNNLTGNASFLFGVGKST